MKRIDGTDLSAGKIKDLLNEISVDRETISDWKKMQEAFGQVSKALGISNCGELERGPSHSEKQPCTLIDSAYKAQGGDNVQAFLNMDFRNFPDGGSRFALRVQQNAEAVGHRHFPL